MKHKTSPVFIAGGQEALNNISFTAVFGTGGDNLEGGNSNNVSLRLHFLNTDQTLTVNNLNNNEMGKLHNTYNYKKGDFKII